MLIIHKIAFLEFIFVDMVRQFRVIRVILITDNRNVTLEFDSPYLSHPSLIDIVIVICYCVYISR